MITRLKALFFQGDKTEVDGDHQIALATAALLIEIMVVDGHLDEKEESTIKALLKNQFQLEPDEIRALFDEARQEVGNSTSLFQFTHVVNTHFSSEQKFDLTKNLWRIAYADDNLDKYEEHIVRRIADLIHIPHSEFIRAKVAAKNVKQIWGTSV